MSRLTAQQIPDLGPEFDGVDPGHFVAHGATFVAPQGLIKFSVVPEDSPLLANDQQIARRGERLVLSRALDQTIVKVDGHIRTPERNHTRSMAAIITFLQHEQLPGQLTLPLDSEDDL